MSSNLMDTEAGGEQTQYVLILSHFIINFSDMTSRYEGAATEIQAHKKSTGQLGHPSKNTTTDPATTTEAAEQQAERGKRTAENIRYGQTISEGGMGGKTSGQQGEADKEGDVDAGKQRTAAGYGGGKDMDREVGA
jgi:hypothetical protein